MEIIGIGGSNGAGKDTVAEMLVERHGWLFVSLSELLRDEARARGLEPDRQSLRMISSEWRREGGLGVLVERAIGYFETQAAAHKGLVVSSLRHPAETEAIHLHGGKVVWVDADPRIRYERILSRARGNEHALSFEEFVAEEQAEMTHHDGDETTLNLGDVKKQADFVLRNDSTDIELFKNQAEAALGLN